MIGDDMSIQTFVATKAARAVLAASAAAATILAASLNAQTPPRPSAPGGSEAIVPFRIQVPDAVLRDLKSRLERARFADEFPDAGWDYGTNLNYIQSLMTYWRDRYDWRAQERRLNRFSQFKTNIGGLDIHFIHQRSNDPDALPLLLLNGWPSSPVEYDKVIEPLTNASGRRARRGRLPRRRAVDARIRLLGQAAGARVQPGTHGAGLGDADGAPRLQPLHRPRQRLGHLGRHLPGARRQLAHLGAAPGWMSRRTDRRASTSARGDCPAAAGVVEPRVPGDSDDEAADAWPGAERFAARVWRRGSSTSGTRGATTTATSNRSTPRTSSSRTSCSTGSRTPAPRRRVCITSRAM